MPVPFAGENRVGRNRHGPLAAQHFGRPCHVHEIVVVEVECQPAKHECAGGDQLRSGSIGGGERRGERATVVTRLTREPTLSTDDLGA